MNQTLFIIGYVWPEPVTTAAGHRMLQLIDAFQEFGYTVVFGSTATRTEYSLDLEAKGVQCVNLQLNHTSFDAFVSELEPAVVVFDRFMVEEQFGWRVAEFAPKALRVLNTEDLHSLRKAREEVYKRGEEFSVNHWKNHPMILREVASIYRSDLTLMISSSEMELLTQEVGIPENLLLHLPFMLEVPNKEQITAWPSFEERQDFICLGNGKHAPNVEAIKTLKQHIWPLIRKKLPKAKLCIYGAYLPQQILELHNPKNGFEVLGWAENLDETLLNARVLLASIQFGAGIKGKLVDAMRNGTPSVTTPIGAEGMQGDLPWNGTICNDWEHFAQAAINLYKNQNEWQKAQTHGLKLLANNYPKTTLRQKLRDRLAKLDHNLTDHRTQNILGRLLQQQGVAATKFMGKWIEEKNRE